jgi:hypothetical protein
MTDQPGFVRVLLALVVAFGFAAPAPVPAQNSAARDPGAAESQAEPQRRPIRADRVFVWDLQGTWISQAYLDELQRQRSPHAVARKTHPLVIKVEKDGRSYPIVVTNFQKAVLKFLIEVEPARKPESYRLVTASEDSVVSSSDVTYIYFRGKRNAQNKFDALSVADPYFAKRKFVPFVLLPDSLDQVVNRLAIAGKYQDAEGRAYEFTEGGEAILPGRRFAYEVSLDPRAASCELLLSHREHAPAGQDRLGFAWKGSELLLFDVKPVKKDRYACDPRPFARLTAR